MDQLHRFLSIEFINVWLAWLLRLAAWRESSKLGYCTSRVVSPNTTTRPAMVFAPRTRHGWSNMIRSSKKRFVLLTIFLTSIFWLSIELILLNYATRLNSEPSRHPSGTRESDSKQIHSELLSVADFKAMYVTMLPPNPGGLGEGGIAVFNSESEKEAEDEGYEKYKFNEVASSKISLERAIPDNRPSE